MSLEGIRISSKVAGVYPRKDVGIDFEGMPSMGVIGGESWDEKTLSGSEIYPLFIVDEKGFLLEVQADVLNNVPMQGMMAKVGRDGAAEVHFHNRNRGDDHPDLFKKEFVMMVDALAVDLEIPILEIRASWAGGSDFEKYWEMRDQELESYEALWETEYGEVMREVGFTNVEFLHEERAVDDPMSENLVNARFYRD